MPLPAAIAEFMQKHKVGSDEVWPVPGGKAYAVKHAALERLAFQYNITFDLPEIVEANSENGIATMIVKGRMGEFEQWSVGEASPKNCKNSYTWSMAEKRGKDRVILKLLNIHGILYSSEEGEWEDLSADTTAKQKGDLIPVNTEIFKGNGKPKAANAIKKDEPERWREIIADFAAAQTLDDLRFIGEQIAQEVEAWPAIWRGCLEDEYIERRSQIEQSKIRGAA